jgi:hypothetical protein
VDLRREGRVFARSLVGREPGDYVLDAYESFHRQHGARESARNRRFDRALVAIARAHPLVTRMCDAYAARFRRGTSLQRKLVLMLALIECSPQTYELADRPGMGGSALGFPRLAIRGVTELLALLVGALLLLPVHAASALLPEPPERAS